MNNNRIDLNILKKTMSSLQKKVDAADSVGGLQFSWKYLVLYFSIIFMNLLHSLQNVETTLLFLDRSRYTGARKLLSVDVLAPLFFK